MECSNCISRFFNETDDLVSSSPNKMSPIKLTVDSSQDSSQNSGISEDSFNNSQLNIEGQEPIRVPAFFNITPRPVPLSPHCVIEEHYSSNPWATLIATIFLSKTSSKTARPQMKIFFEECPTPYHVLDESPATLERFFVTLGLKKRGHMIWKLSYQFVSSQWRRASDLCGIGKYGEDAYRIFCLGHTDLDPSDRYLKLYLDWLRNHTDFIEYNGIQDSEYFIEDPIL